MVWEALKAYLRGQIISLMANKKNKFETKLLELIKNIADVDKNTHFHHPQIYSRNDYNYGQILTSFPPLMLKNYCLETEVRFMNTVIRQEKFWQTNKGLLELKKL